MFYNLFIIRSKFNFCNDCPKNHIEQKNELTQYNSIFLLDGEKLELLDDIGGFHMRLKAQREKRRNQFASAGPYAGALTARRDIAIRLQKLKHNPPAHTFNFTFSLELSYFQE